MKSRPNCLISYISFIAVMACGLNTIAATAADLEPNTLRAWNLFIDAQEKRISEELASKKGFLVLDFQNQPDREQERRLILSGKVSIKPMTNQGNDSGEIRIPGGIIHHWRGSVWVPGASLDYVLSRVQHPELENNRQEDVLESHVLEKSGDQMKLFLKLQRSKIVTAIYNTEHLVRFSQHGTGRASSRSISTKIAEIEQINASTEREKPQGHDRGFLWKMNSYWRYQQEEGGVIIECESITLSRSIPSFLEAMIRPIIRNIAQESMERTLQSMRVRLEKSHKPKAAANRTADLRCYLRLAFEYRSSAALVVTGSIREKATSAPIATAISSVAMMA
jgi:hypothetical protein